MNTLQKGFTLIELMIYRGRLTAGAWFRFFRCRRHH
ncbi:prepilin-type N-terminal cleavage/methylation domain-containing protein [Neisseria gonorrhoeae]|nr:prepilin-type N-terminal cleavage/methylation domain-containing protein [Neisseria gonorrhoeae]